ncbi:hypothetical protein GN244_ATG06988 [Phytophthora infestans]|uniref:Cytochrome P450 n=1 Tax=Phytophthora infestans TaxID=4787 RepID=A0A833TCA2_PHYIN|nr:hypothetical protein GN244_ATG06988 [Phytophthora infestans]
MLDSQPLSPLLATVFALLLVLWKITTKPSPHTNGQKLFRPTSTLPFLEQSLASGGKPWLLTGIGQLPKIIVTAAAAYEDVFKTQFDVFVRGPGETVLEVLGEGIFNVDGDK